MGDGDIDGMRYDEIGPKIEAAVNDAISQVIGEHEGGFVTKWIALVETVSPDGTRGLWPMTSSDVKAWDTKGMLQHALDLQTAQTFAAYNADDD